MLQPAGPKGMGLGKRILRTMRRLGDRKPLASWAVLVIVVLGVLQIVDPSDAVVSTMECISNRYVIRNLTQFNEGILSIYLFIYCRQCLTVKGTLSNPNLQIAYTVLSQFPNGLIF